MSEGVSGTHVENGPSKEPLKSSSCLCIICAEAADPRIEKDDGFLSSLDLYWKAVGVDVKPEMTRAFFLCLPCYEGLLEFYQINEVLVVFEKKLKTVQKTLVRKNVKGIVAWQEKDRTPLPFQVAIMSEWGLRLGVRGGEEEENSAGDGTVVGPYVVTQVKQESQTTSHSSNVEKPQNHPQIQIKSAEAAAAVAAVQTTLKRKAEEERNNEVNQGNKRVRRTTTSTSEDSEVSSSSRSLESSESDPDLHPCQICLSKFSSSSQLTKHVIQHKVGGNEGKYECINCFEIFDKKLKFLEHKKNDCLSLVSPSRVILIE